MCVYGQYSLEKYVHIDNNSYKCRHREARWRPWETEEGRWKPQDATGERRRPKDTVGPAPCLKKGKVS